MCSTSMLEAFAKPGVEPDLFTVRASRRGVSALRTTSVHLCRNRSKLPGLGRTLAGFGRALGRYLVGAASMPALRPPRVLMFGSGSTFDSPSCPELCARPRRHRRSAAGARGIGRPLIRRCGIAPVLLGRCLGRRYSAWAPLALPSACRRSSVARRPPQGDDGGGYSDVGDGGERSEFPERIEKLSPQQLMQTVAEHLPNTAAPEAELPPGSGPVSRRFGRLCVG